jgi:hypothetical protein
MHVELVRDLAIDGLQELLELDRSVPTVQPADAMTRPVVMSSAAYRLEVPERL